MQTSEHTISPLHRAKGISIFFSYKPDVRKDKTIFRSLINHLASLIAEGRIRDLHDSAVEAGNDWRRSVEAYIRSADIIVVLISAEFLASPYCREIEMKQALKRADAGEARLLAIRVHPVDWTDPPLDPLHQIPPDGRSVSDWKSRDLALFEITKGIRKVVEELTSNFSHIFSRSRGPNFPLIELPYRPNPLFTGREDLLDKLHRYFTLPGDTHIQALSGLGGMGKTQIANAYAYRYEDEYDIILWVNANSYDLLCSEILTFADRLYLPVSGRVDAQHVLTVVRRWLQHQQRWLLVLDGIDNLELVDRIVPPRYSGHVLLTTRLQATGSIALSHIVEAMSSDESVWFLLRRAKIITEWTTQEDIPPADYAQALSIVQALGGLPLALDQAGAYIEETRKKPAEYLALYRERQVELLQRRGNFSNGHPQSVATTFALAFDKVAQISPAALDLLYLLAFLHPEAIPEDMILRGASELHDPLRSLASDQLALDSAIASLLDFSLLYHHADSNTLYIHRVIQAVLKGRLSTKQEREWAASAVRLVNCAFPDVDVNNWPLCQRYLAQAQMCAEIIATFNLTLRAAAQLLYRLGSYCCERALYSEAQKYLQAALRLNEQIVGPEHLDTARNLKALALLLMQQGHYQQAEIFQQRALALYEQHLGAQHIDTISVISDLALLYQKQGKSEQALSLHLRVLSLYEHLLGPDHPNTATTLNNLGLFHYEQCQYDQAEPFLQRALAIRTAVLPKDHPSLAQSLNNLALLYLDQEQLARAEPLFLRAVALNEQCFGNDHPETVATLNNLATLYDSQGNFQQAETLYLRIIASYERMLGPEHPDLALTINNLASLHYQQEHYEQAEHLYQQALTMCEQTLGPEHPHSLLLLNNLATLYLTRENTQQAEPLLTRALAVCEQTVGPDHVDTARSLNNLAGLFFLQKKYQQAADLYRRAIAIYEQWFGPDHQEVATTKVAYVSLLEQMHRPQEAQTFTQSLPTAGEDSVEGVPNQTTESASDQTAE